MPPLEINRPRQRRAHAKSRGGCVECKRQHKKCDEARPNCGACKRLSADCCYIIPDAKRPRGRIHARAESQHAPSAGETTDTSPTQAGTPVSQAVAGDELNSANTSLDLELMANVFIDDVGFVLPVETDTTTAKDFVRNKLVLARSYPYLMHEMLAVSGLSLFAAAPQRRELMTRALFHQSRALQLVQPHITSASKEHFLALLFFTSYAALCGLAEPAFCDSHDDSFDPIEKVLHAFQLSRGIMMILAPSWAELRQTWAWPFIQSQIDAGNDLTPRPDSIPGYTFLRCLALGVEDEAGRKSCMKALDFTLGAISLVQRRKDHSMSRRLVTSWPMETDATFQGLLSERRPVSLLILAYYAVLLKLGTGVWWVGNWPVVLIKHLESTLGDEWAELLRWPKEIVLSAAHETLPPSDQSDAVT